MTHEQSQFHSGGFAMFVQSWVPAYTPRAVLAIVHGIGEHSDRYTNLVNHLVQQRIAVFAFDLRGHGRSPGKRGHIESWGEYRDDTGAFLDYVGSRVPDCSLFLYGHSMGALIALDYVLEYPKRVLGLITSGIPLQPSGAAKPHLIAIARVLSRIVPAFSISLGLDPSGISSDAAVVKAYLEDPLVHTKVSMRWGTEILKTIDRTRARLGEVQLPLLVLHGAADPINSPAGSDELYEAAQSADKTVRMYPDTRHEPHNDRSHAAVARDIADWIAARSILPAD